MIRLAQEFTAYLVIGALAGGAALAAGPVRGMGVVVAVTPPRYAT